MNLTEQYLIFKSEKEKNDIVNYLNTKELYIDDFTLESMTNVISAAKNNLNEELKELMQYKSDFVKSRIYTSIINAKNEKINKLIDMYNESNSYNKIQFTNNVIDFKSITTVDDLKLEIENFNYDIPMNFQFVMYSYDGEIITKDIIPFNYSGLYSEYIDINSDVLESIFSVSNKNNIYFYSCSYTEKGFTLGSEIKLEKNKDYAFDKNGKIVFDKESIQHKEFIIKYQPNENAYEIKDIFKRLYKIELIVNNDKMNVNEKFKKKLVMFND